MGPSSLPLLIRWIDSDALVTVVGVLLFVPVFLASYGLADVLTGFTSREDREEEERQRKVRSQGAEGKEEAEGKERLVTEG